MDSIDVIFCTKKKNCHFSANVIFRFACNYEFCECLCNCISKQFVFCASGTRIKIMGDNNARESKKISSFDTKHARIILFDALLHPMNGSFTLCHRHFISLLLSFSQDVVRSALLHYFFGCFRFTIRFDLVFYLCCVYASNRFLFRNEEKCAKKTSTLVEEQQMKCDLSTKNGSRERIESVEKSASKQKRRKSYRWTLPVESGKWQEGWKRKVFNKRTNAKKKDLRWKAIFFSLKYTML